MTLTKLSRPSRQSRLSRDMWVADKCTLSNGVHRWQFAANWSIVSYSLHEGVTAKESHAWSTSPKSAEQFGSVSAWIMKIKSHAKTNNWMSEILETQFVQMETNHDAVKQIRKQIFLATEGAYSLQPGTTFSLHSTKFYHIHEHSAETKKRQLQA